MKMEGSTHFNSNNSGRKTFFFAVIATVWACPLWNSAAHAQFVYPKPEYNQPKPGAYVEDPFIVKYRRKFFAVFHGDYATFNQAYGEIEAQLKKDPKDARAMVWLGNGQTVKAGVLMLKGKASEAIPLMELSRITLDKAVALRPADPNIYMMRAATLYIQGQYWPAATIPKKNWETLRFDCLNFINFIGPKRMNDVSIHVRGEAYGELGIAYLNLGDTTHAKAAFQKITKLNPGTDYAKRALKEIAKIEKSSK